MEQLSFTDLEAGLRRKTRKTHVERLTERLEELVPWTALQDLIRPLYHPSGRRGRQPFPLDLMLRIHLLQAACNLGDPRMGGSPPRELHREEVRRPEPDGPHA